MKPSTETPVTSPIKSIKEILAASSFPADEYTGIKFVAIKNVKNLYVIPGIRTYIDTIQFKSCIVDCGCSSWLLRIASKERACEIVRRYIDDDLWDVKLGKSTGTSGESLTLLIESQDAGYKFPVKISTDLFLDAPSCSADRLRFVPKMLGRSIAHQNCEECFLKEISRNLTLTSTAVTKFPASLLLS